MSDQAEAIARELLEEDIPMVGDGFIDPAHLRSIMPDIKTLAQEYLRLEEEQRGAVLTLAAVVMAAGGEVRVPKRILVALPATALQRTEDIATDSIVFRATENAEEEK